MTRTWLGVVKVKMLHRPGGTILLPEALIVGGAGNQWAQPQFVYAPTLAFTDDDAFATIPVAVTDSRLRVARGLDCVVQFRRADLLASLSDRSQVYRCRVNTDYSPAQLAVGRARSRADGGIDLRLFHHTTSDALSMIHASGQVRGSTWNYQGTRELTNVAYAYFTSLRSIATEMDLRRIAMASDGKIMFQLDTTQGSAPDLVLDVYRASTRDRKATLSLWLAAEAISTPHIWQHIGPPVVYEVAHPWIFRVGLNPDRVLEFAAGVGTPGPSALRDFDYAVIGDCTTVGGLAAPFDEENTTYTFVVQDLAGSDVFTFWRNNANTPLHRDPTDAQMFKP